MTYWQPGMPPFRVPAEHLDVLSEEIKEVRPTSDSCNTYIPTKTQINK
jgi:hypothetical protein